MEIRVNDYEEPEQIVDSDRERYSVSRTCGYEKLSMSHIHNTCEILLVEAGRASYDIGGRTYQVETGDILVIGAMEFYRSRIEEPPYQRCGLRVSPAYLKSFLVEEDLQAVFATPGPEQFHGRLKKADRRIFRRMKELMDRLRIERETNLPFGSQMCRVILTELAVILFRLSGSERQYGEITAADARMRDVRAYIDTHFREKLSLDSLSGRFYLHPSTISKEFKRYCGYNVNRYINTVRVCEAANLLEFGSDSVARVGELCGYDSENTFLRQFRTVMSMSPLQYRKAARAWSGRILEKEEGEESFVRESDPEIAAVESREAKAGGFGDKETEERAV